MSRIVVEWVKEANVNFIVGDLVGLDEKPRWEKCKLRLVKASGGFLLEFFVPPKVGFGLFFKVATTLVDLLCIELMPHLLHAKQIYSLPIRLTH